MKIVLACPYAWDAPGGVQVHVRQLAAHLLQKGHRVLVLAPSRSTPHEAHVLGVGRPISIPFNGSVAPIAPSPQSSRRVRRALEEFRPDVVHAHEPLVPGTALFAARWARAPVVATFHAFAKRSIILSAVAPLLRSVWRRLSIRVAVSEAAAEFVAGRFPANGVRVIPNGADVDLFEKAEPADLPAGRKVLFVNRLDPRKGFSVMVEAFGGFASRYPDVLLVVAGDGRQRNAVRRLPQEIRDRVVMLGNVPHHLLPPYHAACDVFCGPATGGESFGIVLVEAMAAGLPVVASDIPGYREVVRAGTDGLLVSPGDPRALGVAVEEVLGDPSLAARLSEAGRSRARRYSWDTVAREIEMTYEEAVGGR